MLMRNSNTGAFEVYDISHNAITSAASLGQVGLEWQVGGFANYAPTYPVDPAGNSTALLAQAMASFGASSAAGSAPGTILGDGDSPQTLLVAAPQPH
jgi:hypothetical protein